MLAFINDRTYLDDVIWSSGLWFAQAYFNYHVHLIGSIDVERNSRNTKLCKYTKLLICSLVSVSRKRFEMLIIIRNPNIIKRQLWVLQSYRFRFSSIPLNCPPQKDRVFTRGQFWPSGIVVACVCLSVCVSVNPELVRAINHHTFKIEPPNLDKRCKRTWLRSLLFWGAIDLDLQGQIQLEKPNVSLFQLVHAITHHIFKLEPSNLDKRCKPTCLWYLLFWRTIDHDLHSQI